MGNTKIVAVRPLSTVHSEQWSMIFNLPIYIEVQCHSDILWLHKLNDRRIRRMGEPKEMNLNHEYENNFETIIFFPKSLEIN